LDTTLGAYLLQLRQARGISPTQLAARSHVSRSTLYNWESGQRLPRLQELEAVLRALDATAAQAQSALTLLQAPRAQKRLQEMEKLPISMPNGGDLLRALRLRRGWTQGQAAAAVQVSQPTLARWERGDAWPGQEILLKLCFCLGARQAEITALTPGPYSLSGNGLRGEEKVTVESLEASLSGLEAQLKDPEYYPLGDMFYLNLEAQAITLARKTLQAQILLARIMMEHAGYLGQRCQPAEAGRVAEKAVALLPRQGEQWNALRVSGDMYRAVWKYPIREHSRILSHWLGRALDTRHRSWVMGQIASSIMEQGDGETALEIKREIMALAKRAGDAASYQRQLNSYAETLVQVGRGAEATDMIVTDMLSLPGRVRMKLAITEANLAAGNRSKAHDSLQEVCEDNARLDIDYYDPQINSLAKRI
jgi:transcriptional regulator with XRE-family HTH domain